MSSIPGVLFDRLSEQITQNYGLYALNNALESAELLVIISCFMSRLGIVNRRFERYGSDELLCN